MNSEPETSYIPYLYLIDLHISDIGPERLNQGECVY